MGPSASILPEPAPFEEAAAFLRDKPAVLQRTFARMIPEVRARAFTVSGIETVNALQEVRELIAELPRGAAWNEVKEGIAGRLTWLGEEAAGKRAELILRMNGFQAYAAAQHEARSTPEAQAAFPYLQYVATGDEATRESHRALDGLILPAGHPFWRDHTPPWDYGCRCQLVPVSPEEFEEALAEKRVAGEAPALREDARRRGWAIPPGSATEKRLMSSGRLDWGDGHGVDVRTPVQRARTGGERRAAYSWNPGDLRLPLESLRERYDVEEWAAFQSAMERAHVLRPEGRERVWDWLLAPSIEQARNRALAFGAEMAGREMAVLVNYSTGATVATVEGTRQRVHLSPALAKARRQRARVVVVHNHPGGDTFSPRDIIRLIESRDAVEQIEAHGQWFRHIARIGPGNENPERLMDALNRFDALHRKNILNPAEWRAWLRRQGNNEVLFYERRVGQ